MGVAQSFTVALLLWLGYLFAYAVVHPFAGATAALLAIIPSVFGGALLGLGWGVAISIASAAGTSLLWVALGDAPGSVILRAGGGIGAIAMIAVAAGVGRIRDLDQETIRRLRERDQLIATLRGSEQRLAAVASQLPIVILAFDADGTIWRSEGTELATLGLATGSQDGRSLYALCLTPDDQAAVRAALAGGSGPATASLDGRKLRFSCAPTRDPSGMITGGVAVGLID